MLEFTSGEVVEVDLFMVWWQWKQTVLVACGRRATWDRMKGTEVLPVQLLCCERWVSLGSCTLCFGTQQKHVNQIVGWNSFDCLWLGSWQLNVIFLILWGGLTGGSNFDFLFLEKSLVKVNDWPCLVMSKLLGMFRADNNFSFLWYKVLVFNWN